MSKNINNPIIKKMKFFKVYFDFVEVRKLEITIKQLKMTFAHIVISDLIKT